MQPAVVVLIALAVVLVASVAFLWLRSREATLAGERQHSSTWLVWLAGLLGLAVTLVDWIALRAQALVALNLAVGGGLFLVGLVFRILSRRALGRYYTPRLVILPDHRLVTSGIYAVIRHPGYLGFLLWAVGLSVALASWLGLAVMVGAFLPAILYRIHHEEALLRAHFGAAYEDYAARTKRLLPFVFSL